METEEEAVVEVATAAVSTTETTAAESAVDLVDGVTPTPAPTTAAPTVLFQ